MARLRFFSERDIGGAAGGVGSERVVRAITMLQNTLEQAVLAIAAHVILAATFDRIELSVRVLVGLFVAGRVLFVTGYRRGAAARSFGFALTFYPSVLALLWCGIAMSFG